MHPRKEGDRWVIVDNVRTVNSDGVTVDGWRDFGTRTVFDCWDGTGWCGQLEMALDFPNEAEAMQYIEANRGKLELSD
jgi:hypothetical protein